MGICRSMRGGESERGPPAVVRRICGYVGLYVWWRLYAWWREKQLFVKTTRQAQPCFFSRSSIFVLGSNDMKKGLFVIITFAQDRNGRT
jgi:hypothetical protein